MEFFRFLPIFPFMCDCKGDWDRLVCHFINMLLILIFTSPFLETQMVRFLDDHCLTEIEFWLRACWLELFFSEADETS